MEKKAENTRKEKLDMVFRLSDKESIFEFLKTCAYNNNELAKMLIDEFLDDEASSDDYRNEVENIFLYAYNDMSSDWGPSKDWSQINMELYRLIQKAYYLIKTERYNDAAAIACQIITSVGIEYTDDQVYKSNRYDGDDFYTHDAAKILTSLVTNKRLDIHTTEDILLEITEASNMETYRSYCVMNLKMLVNALKGGCTDAETYLSELDNLIETAENIDDKQKWIIQKTEYLAGTNMTEQLNKLIVDNYNIPELCMMKIETHLGNKEYDMALDSINKALDSIPQDKFIEISKLHKQKLSVCQTTNNTEGQIEEYLYTIKDGWSNKYDAYIQLKRLMDEESLHETMNEIMEQLATDNYIFGIDEIAKICAEEQLYIILGKVLCFNDNNDNTTVYEALKEYSNLLTTSQRMFIVDYHINEIRKMALITNSKLYYSIRYQMEQLLDSCKEATTPITELVEEFKRNYKRRPSMMAEIKKINECRLL